MPTPVMRDRTRAREAALARLYSQDLAGQPFDADWTPAPPDQSLSAEATAYARGLVSGVAEHHADIDRRISQASDNWELKRMPVVDRNILRLAVWELVHGGEVPAKVVINEGIELGKRFSTEKSGAFINGILDRIHKELLARAEPC